MPSSSPSLASRPCADLPEFDAFRQQDYRKQALLQQTGGGEAFVAAAAPVIRKSVLQALPYGSPSAKYVQALRSQGVTDEVLDQALARAWLADASEFKVPKPPVHRAFLGTAALLGYSVVAVLVFLTVGILWLRHADPVLAEYFLGVPPIFAVAGVPLVVVLFTILRKLVHR
jgi:hypothetical protein